MNPFKYIKDKFTEPDIKKIKCKYCHSEFPINMHYCPYCLLDKNGIHFLEGHIFTNFNFYHIFLTIPYKEKHDIFAIYDDLDKTFNMIDKPKELPGITTSIYKDINTKKLNPIDLHWYYQGNIKDSDELFKFKVDTNAYPISPSGFTAHMNHCIADVYSIKEIGDYSKSDDRFISIQYAPNIPDKVYFFDNAGTDQYYYLSKRSNGIGLYRPINCILEWYDTDSNRYTITSNEGFKNKNVLYFVTEKNTNDGILMEHLSVPIIHIKAYKDDLKLYHTNNYFGSGIMDKNNNNIISIMYRQEIHGFILNGIIN